MAKNNFKKFNDKEVVERPVEESVKVNGVVNCPLLNVRKDASPDSDVITTIEQNTKVLILGDENDFYNVSLKSGVEGYCVKQFIDVK